MAQPQISNDDGWVPVDAGQSDWVPVDTGTAVRVLTGRPALDSIEAGQEAEFGGAGGPAEGGVTGQNVKDLAIGASGTLNPVTWPGDATGLIAKLGDLVGYGVQAALSKAGLMQPNKQTFGEAVSEPVTGNPLPTSKGVTNAMFGPPKNTGEAALRTTGGALAGQVIPGEIGAVEGAVKGVGGAAKTFMPGAFSRIQAPVFNMAPDIEMGAPSEIDNQVSQTINARKAALMKARSQEAQTRLAEIAAQSGSYAPTVGKQIRDYLAQHFQDNAGSMTESQGKLYEQAANQTVANRQLTNPVGGQVVNARTNLEGYDNARRMLNDIGSGDMEGYDAVTQARAKELASGISTIMRNAVPKFDQYLDWYKQASEPLDAFKTPEVSKFVKPSSEFDMTPKYIAGAGKTMFSSPTAYSRFTDAIGNPALVEQISRNKAANDLITLTENQQYSAGAKAVQRWINRNEWIKNAPPDVQQTVTDYQQALEKIGRVRKGVITGVAAGALLHYGHTVWGLRALLAGAQ